MADSATRRVALLSIRPQYAEQILAGRKRVEFRRRPLPREVSRVVIYATAPVARIVGAFEIEAIDSTTPREAWQHYHQVGGIGQEAFDSYYEGTDTAHVIRIGDVEIAQAPFALSEIDESLRPPQSFMYLRDRRLTLARQLIRRPDRPRNVRDTA
jgi:predicted transcriptional regulator